MYINQITIRNIRSIDALDWKVDYKSEAGWHVILGNNGSGKSTFIRCIALAVVGPSEALALRQNWDEWLRKGQQTGSIQIEVEPDEKLDRTTGRGKKIAKFFIPAYLILHRQKEKNDIVRLKHEINAFDNIDAKRYFWGVGAGWFCASYGPFRRFSGGDKDYEKFFYSNPKLARHLSAFGENIALTESLAWFQGLEFKRLENPQSHEATLLSDVISFINQPDFLPNDVKMVNVSSAGVHFVDGNNMSVLIEQLSDGYRSVLSLTFELIRQLSLCYGTDIFETENDGNIVVKVPGIVLIDEVDAHLHPTWQRRIGFWFREHFPQIQFIVTTHSPLVCQAAEKGSIFQLPRPGTDETGRMLTGTERDRLLYGNILDAYSTEAFGAGITRSEVSEQMLERLGELNVKEMTANLTKKEQEEQERLRATLPTSASTVL